MAVELDFQRALTNVEDGVKAGQTELENRVHFAEEAKAAFDGLPDWFPYVDEYRASLEELDFDSAFATLTQLAAFIEAREYDEQEYNFDYSPMALERVQDSYREYCSSE